MWPEVGSGPFRTSASSFDEIQPARIIMDGSQLTGGTELCTLGCSHWGGEGRAY